MKTEEILKDLMEQLCKASGPMMGVVNIASGIEDAYAAGFEDGQQDALEVVGDLPVADFAFDHDASNFVDAMRLDVDDLNKKWFGFVDRLNEKSFKTSEALEYIANTSSDPRVLIAMTFRFCKAVEEA